MKNGDKLVVELLALTSPALIARAETGVVYTNQTGGINCHHPRAEGFLVPVQAPVAGWSKFFDADWWYLIAFGMAVPFTAEQWAELSAHFRPDELEALWGRTLEEANTRKRARYVLGRWAGEDTPRNQLSSPERVARIDAWLSYARMPPEDVWAAIEAEIRQVLPSFSLRLDEGEEQEEAWVHCSFEVDGRPFNGVLTWPNSD